MFVFNKSQNQLNRFYGRSKFKKVCEEKFRVIKVRKIQKSKQKYPQNFRYAPEVKPELKKLEWDILNPVRLINLEINNKRSTSLI